MNALFRSIPYLYFLLIFISLSVLVIGFCFYFKNKIDNSIEQPNLMDIKLDEYND